jgi:hypothetical protein
MTSYNKDESQNFIAQLRDSSDLTTMLRQNAIRQNYRVLNQKGFTPVGGIPANDLYDMAHTTGVYGPAMSIMNSGSMQPCVTCSGQFPFNLLQVSVSLIRY